MENAELITKILRGDKDSVLSFTYVNEYEEKETELSE